MLLQTNKRSPSLSLMIRLLSICWLATKLLCYKLWLSNRLFPLVPVHDSLLNIPPAIHLILFMATLAALAALAALPSKKWIVVVLIVTEIASCLLDENRWQPWEYQFTFMMMAYALFTDERRIKTSWQVIFIGVYFFSGLNKLNPGFIMQVWHSRIMNQWLGITLHNAWAYRLGYILPLFEMAGALALLFTQTRKIGVIMLGTMHLFILTMLGPLGLHFLNVIWPWNVVMLCLLIGLFYKDSFSFGQLKFRQIFTWIVVACWWVLPWLHLVGLWDSYFSSSLYSGKTQYLYVCTSNVKTKELLKENFIHTTNSQPCDSLLSVFRWSMRELNTSPNPELRVYKKIVARWKEKMDSAGNDKYFIHFPKFSKAAWVQLPPGK